MSPMFLLSMLLLESCTHAHQKRFIINVCCFSHQILFGTKFDLFIRRLAGLLLTIEYKMSKLISTQQMNVN